MSGFENVNPSLPEHQETPLISKWKFNCLKVQAFGTPAVPGLLLGSPTWRGAPLDLTFRTLLLAQEGYKVP